MVRSLGVGKLFEWSSLDARGVAGDVVIYRDNWVLELVRRRVYPPFIADLNVLRLTLSGCYLSCIL